MAEPTNTTIYTTTITGEREVIKDGMSDCTPVSAMTGDDVLKVLLAIEDKGNNNYSCEGDPDDSIKVNEKDKKAKDSAIKTLAISSELMCSGYESMCSDYESLIGEEITEGEESKEEIKEEVKDTKKEISYTDRYKFLNPFMEKFQYSEASYDNCRSFCLNIITEFCNLVEKDKIDGEKASFDYWTDKSALAFVKFVQSSSRKSLKKMQKSQLQKLKKLIK